MVVKLSRKLPLVLFALCLGVIILSFGSLIFAESVELGYIYEIADKEAADGDILAYDAEKNLIRAQEPYNDTLFGVLQEKPILLYRYKGVEGKPVMKRGIAYVNVTTLNGEVGPGDYITSSEIPGKGQRASHSGYVIGKVADYPESGQSQALNYEGQELKLVKVPVELNIEFVESSKFETPDLISQFENFLSLDILKEKGNAILLTRYIVSALIVVLSIWFSFRSFSTAVTKGIEAIGRNPLAKGSILFSVVLNSILILLVIGGSLVAAFLILRL